MADSLEILDLICATGTRGGRPGEAKADTVAYTSLGLSGRTGGGCSTNIVSCTLGCILLKLDVSVVMSELLLLAPCMRSAGRLDCTGCAEQRKEGGPRASLSPSWKANTRGRPAQPRPPTDKRLAVGRGRIDGVVEWHS